jgi:glutamate synthase (NADPH/NADH) small chain
MGKITGFLEYDRQTPEQRPVDERLRDFKEVYQPMDEQAIIRQAARCMDCGVPFCHSGCPLGNLCPEWNDLVYRGQWRLAWERLSATNNFPEFTGRLCPALCEEACVLGIHEGPTAIQTIEKAIVERAFESGWVQPQPPPVRTGKRVAVIGSGPSGLAAAQQLNRAGHAVTVFEKSERPAGCCATASRISNWRSG